MPKTKNLTSEVRAIIADRHANGQSLTSLAMEFKIFRSTVASICAKIKQTGFSHDLKRSGRPTATSSREDRFLFRMQRRNPRASSRQMQHDFETQCGISVSAATIRNRMRSFGLKCRIAAKKCMISAANKQKRLKWAKKYKCFATEDFMKVMWSDETPIHLVQTAQQRRIRCFRKEVLFPGMTRPMV